MTHHTNHGNHGRHGLLMLFCCLIPLAIIALVYGLGIPLSGFARTALILICPLSHLLMMRSMLNHQETAQVEPAHVHARAEDVASSVKQG